MSTVTSLGPSISTSAWPPGVKLPLCSPLSRLSGVNRQISSIPRGTGWSASSKDPAGCRYEVTLAGDSTASATTRAASSTTVTSADRAFHLHLDQAAVGGTPAAPRHRLGDDRARGVRRAVHHLGAGVLVLALAGKGDGQ